MPQMIAATESPPLPGQYILAKLKNGEVVKGKRSDTEPTVVFFDNLSAICGDEFVEWAPREVTGISRHPYTRIEDGCA